MTSLSSEESIRYARNLALPELGETGQLKLKNACVALVGLGGLGSPIALYLAAAGVGHLKLIDPDCVSVSNLQRQIIHSEATEGELKPLSAAARLHGLNSHIRITPVTSPLTRDNAEELLAGCDVVIDAVDNFATRFTLADAAAKLRLPLVHGGVRGFRGEVTVFAPYDGTACYRCLFPENAAEQNQDTASVAGILGAHAGLVGSVQALETLKLIAGIASPLRGSLLSIDSLSMRFRLIALAPNPHCTCCRKPQAGNES